MQKTAFKNNVYYVDPVPLFLGNYDNGKVCFSQYVPVQQTIAALTRESVCEQHAATHAQPSTENGFHDVRDGKGVQGNPLFKIEPSSVFLIL